MATKNKNLSLKKPKSRRLPFWAWPVIVLVLLGLALAGYFAFGQNNSQMDSPETAASEPINFDPPTATEQQDAEETKDRIVSEQENSSSTPNPGQPQSPGSKKGVTPTITEASRSVVKVYVTGIFEEGGTCTATFTKGSQTLTKSSDGFQNASYTQCAPIELSGNFLSSGKWSVTVKYSSSVSEGTSEVQYIE